MIDRIAPRVARWQHWLALACVAVLAVDIAIDAYALPELVEHALVAVAAGLGIARPSEVADDLARGRGRLVLAALLTALAGDAASEVEVTAAEPAPDAGELSDSSSSGGSTDGA